MRTQTFKNVLQGVAMRLGVDPASSTAVELAATTDFVNDWLKVGWEHEFWAELTPLELRAFRDAYNAGTTYAAGAEIFYTDGAYYSANLAPNTPVAGESPASAPTKWTVLTSFERYVSLDQAGQTPIGEVLAVYRSNPRINVRFPGKIDFTLTDKGIMPAPLAGAQVWVSFRLRPNRFSSTPWSASEANVAGDIRYRPDTTGECYLALSASTGQVPENVPAKWQKVDLPDRLAFFVKKMAYAESLRSDGQADKAEMEEGKAYNQLYRASDVAFASQGQYDRATAAVY